MDKTKRHNSKVTKGIQAGSHKATQSRFTSIIEELTNKEKQNLQTNISFLTNYGKTFPETEDLVCDLESSAFDLYHTLLNISFFTELLPKIKESKNPEQFLLHLKDEKTKEILDNAKCLSQDKQHEYSWMDLIYRLLGSREEIEHIHTILSESGKDIDEFD